MKILNFYTGVAGGIVLVRFFATSVGQLLKIKALTSLEASGSYYRLMQCRIHEEWSRHYNERSDSIKKQRVGCLILD